MNVKTKRISAINYFGGKQRYLEFYLGLIPDGIYHWVETCCGSAAVTLNKKPSPIETISDIDGRVINFMRVLRNQKQFKKLHRSLQLTLYNHNEFDQALEMVKDPIEDARRFFVRALQSFGGHCDTTRRVNSWRVNNSESRYNMSLDVSKWLSKIKGLPEVVARLQTVQIDNRDLFEMLKIYDSADTLFFIDPPYLPDVRTGTSDYRFEMTHHEHELLSVRLASIKGKFILCGYEHPDMDEWYPADKFVKVAGPDRATNLAKSKSAATREMVWLNYRPYKQTELFTITK